MMMIMTKILQKNCEYIFHNNLLSVRVIICVLCVTVIIKQTKCIEIHVYKYIFNIYSNCLNKLTHYR